MSITILIEGFDISIPAPFTMFYPLQSNIFSLVFTIERKKALLFLTVVTSIGTQIITSG